MPSILTNISGRAFYGCKKLVNKDGFIIINGILFDYLGEETNVIIPHGTTKISDAAFMSKHIESVAIPESVKSIGKWAFMNCHNLSNVTLPSSITQINACTFEDCPGITRIHIPENVESIEYGAFQDCSNLEELYLSPSITNIGRKAFYNCKRLVIKTISGSYVNQYAKRHHIKHNVT